MTPAPLLQSLAREQAILKAVPSLRVSANVRLLLLALLPDPLRLQHSLPSPPPPASPALVLDKSGATLANARISLKLDSLEKQTTSDAAGRFTFPDIPSGPFTISIAADGFVTLNTSGAIHPSTAEQLPQIILPVATVDTDVEVTVSRQDLAEAEVKVEEHQRLFGAIPNFFVAYDWHAASLTSGQKFELSWRSVADPFTILLNAGFAGIEQATNAYPGWGQGTATYFKRFGAANGDVLVGTFLGGYVFPAVFHQDPRYFYMGHGSILHRTLYALSTAVIARGDNGKWQPGYAAILGDLSAGAVSNLYYPASSRQGATLTFENGLLSIASDGVGNVIQEFLLRHLTHNPPTYTPPTP